MCQYKSIEKNKSNNIIKTADIFYQKIFQPIYCKEINIFRRLNSKYHYIFYYLFLRDFIKSQKEYHKNINTLKKTSKNIEFILGGKPPNPEIDLIVQHSEGDDLAAFIHEIYGTTDSLKEIGAILSWLKPQVIQWLYRDDPNCSNYLMRGKHGQEIIALQRRLRREDFDLCVDGFFGPATELAIKVFQTSVGLEANGIVDAKTKAHLEDAEGWQSDLCEIS